MWFETICTYCRHEALLISGKSTSPTTQSQKSFILSKMGSYQYSHFFSQSILALIQAKFSALIIILSVAGLIIAAATIFCCFKLKRQQQREREAFIQKFAQLV